MNKTHFQTLLVAGILAFSLCAVSPAAAAPGASLTVPSVNPGVTTLATVTLTDIADIESFTLTLDFAPGESGTVLTLPASGWFTRGAYYPVSPFGTAPTVELNNAFESTARTRVFIDGFKPTGTAGAVGTVKFQVGSSLAPGTPQQVSLTGQYLSKASKTVVTFPPVSTQFTVSNARLTAVLVGTGSGAVNSNPAGIACTSDSCSSLFTPGSSVSLMATPESSATFGGWSGACTDKGSCSLTMDGDKSVTATFTLAPKAMIATQGYATIQAAYNAAASGATIKLLEGIRTETTTFGSGKTVTLEGGYNATYSGISTETTINGKVQIRSGTVRMKRVNVR